jgi:hypothetical protein
LVDRKFVTKKLNSVVSRSNNYEGKREMEKKELEIVRKYEKISERASLEFGVCQEAHSVT